jgi:hypothetical protein
MNIRRPIFFALLLCLSISGIANGQGTRLLRHPTVSHDSVAFEYAGDLWIVSRSGGQARRLTSTPGAEMDPYFSPDGTQIAFYCLSGADTGLYLVPASGGPERKLRSTKGGWGMVIRRVLGAAMRTVPLMAAFFIPIAVMGVPKLYPWAMPLEAIENPTIREHLVQNLSIDEGDFEVLPVFLRFGGWKKANAAFSGKLPQLIQSFNKAIAL